MHGWLAPHLVALALAQTSPSPTAVLPVIVGEIEIGAAEIEAAARVAAEHRLGVRLIPAERASIDFERSTRCGGDARCLADLYAESAATSVLVVVVNAVASPVVLSARVLDVASARFVAEKLADVSSTRARDRLPPLIAAAFEEAGQRQWATLSLSLTPTTARVVLGATAATSGTVQLPPGPVELTASAEGYQTRHLSLLLEPGELRALSVELEPEPSWIASPFLWIGSAAVVIAAVTTVVVLTLPERDTRLCLTPCP